MSDVRENTIEQNPPEVEDPKKVAERNLSKKRLFYLIVFVDIILLLLLGWELIELFLPH